MEPYGKIFKEAKEMLIEIYVVNTAGGMGSDLNLGFYTEEDAKKCVSFLNKIPNTKSKTFQYKSEFKMISEKELKELKKQNIKVTIK